MTFKGIVKCFDIISLLLVMFFTLIKLILLLPIFICVPGETAKRFKFFKLSCKLAIRVIIRECLLPDDNKKN